jgi:uncharacterized protein
MNTRGIPHGARRRSGPLVIAVFLFIILFAGRYLASQLLDYEWWKEVHQLDTWISLLLYGTLPTALVALLLFGCFTLAWRVGLRRGARIGLPSPYASSSLLLIAIAVVAFIAASSLVDSWTVVRFFGGLRIPGAASAFHDPIFNKPLRFYFFDLPFYNLLLRLLLSTSVLSLIIYWLSAHFEDLRESLPRYTPGGTLEMGRFSLGDTFDSTFVRIAISLLLIALGVEFFFSRYEFLFDDHGTYLLGVDYLAAHFALPLQWLMIVSSFLAAALVLLKRGRWALVLLIVLPIRYIVPAIVGSAYVRPNELALERPYIVHHIEATRSAYGLNEKLKETQLNAQSAIQIDPAKHKPLLDNVRLWDWKAFHDTVSQIQPLRPYAYFDSDVDRYKIDGSLRQVLITARELDLTQLGESRSRWINPHLIYTHGYGIVMSNANKVTADGLPQFLIEDSPPRISAPGLQFTKPQIYFSENAQEPVYVSTSQPEFDYPSGSDNVHTEYKGAGGFSIDSPLIRLAAAINYGDLNTLLTDYFTKQSKIMIHRRVLERLSTLAGFVNWETDPYPVLDKSGRLVWIVDGYMTSSSHPYSRELSVSGIGDLNYIRNSVKATIDAYSGETHLYVFDPADPLIQAYRTLFPTLLEPESAMPADLRAHVRYPETLFSVQAEIYRAFHMRDPEAFYNRADLWDIAKTSTGSGEATPVKPTYVVATLPGDNTPEFLLITPFTPANKDNLIGMMLARCDGPNLGELVVQQLGKQNIIYGPKQIESFINQDQTISKDLTLWNQQSSEVLRGQVLVLPIENSFLYVEPIYIQASGARMPQLKKVALAMGNHLAYADTYNQALALLIGQTENTPSGAQPGPPTVAVQTGQVTVLPAAPPKNENTLKQIRDHFGRYRELTSQGKYAEAGKEMEAIQKLLNQ